MVPWLVETIPGWKHWNIIGRFQNIPQGCKKISSAFLVCWFGTLVHLMARSDCVFWFLAPCIHNINIPACWFCLNFHYKWLLSFSRVFFLCVPDAKDQYEPHFNGVCKDLFDVLLRLFWGRFLCCLCVMLWSVTQYVIFVLVLCWLSYYG